jgi:hypothetical protein
MDRPIACTLPAGAYRERTAALSALARRALRSREPTAGGERLAFADDPAIEQALRAAIAAEQQCCAFLRLQLVRAHGALVLDITGPDEARPIISALFA